MDLAPNVGFAGRAIMDSKCRRAAVLKLRVALAVVCILMAGIAGGQAEANDQTVVIGAGLGIHTYSKADTIRQGVPGYGGADEIKQAGMGELFAEWYALGIVGFGVRGISLGTTRSYTSAGNQLDESVTVGLTFLTLNVIVAGAESYTRLGLLGGIGSATYKVTATLNGTQLGSNSASGSATLAGTFLDWGGEDFGARFGVNAIQTSIKDMTGGAKVDGSGTSVYFDLRWAWQ
jgi:hypothetical protein